MSEKYKSVPMLFLKTLVLTTVLLGGTVFVLSDFVEKNKEQKVAKNTEITAVEHKKPDNALSLTTLLIMGENGSQSGTSFLLMRFKADEEKLFVTPLPCSMMCQSGTDSMTAFEFFRKNGAESAKKAISETLNIPIEKYVFLDNTGFATAIDSLCGGVEYPVPYNIEYYSESLDENVFIPMGNIFLDGNKIRQYLSTPSFSDKYKSEQSAFILCSALKNATYENALSFSENAGLYESFFSSDISHDEFLSRIECFKNIEEENFTEIIFPTGEWKSGAYYPSTDFKNYLSEKFGVRKLAEIS